MTTRHARLAQEGIGPRARAFKGSAGTLCSAPRPRGRTVRTVPYRTAACVGSYRTAPASLRVCTSTSTTTSATTPSHNHTQAHGHVGAHTQSQRGTGALNTRHWPPAGAGASPNVQLTDSVSAGPLVDGLTLPCGLWPCPGSVICGLWPAGCGQSIPPPSNAQHPSTRYYSSLLNQAPSNLHYLAKYHPFHLHHHSMCHPPHIHSFLRHPSMIQP